MTGGHLRNADGILRTRSYLSERERWVVWLVIVGGEEVAVFSRKRAAKRDLERRLRDLRAER